jgi:two-component system, OmpR family, sensor histidine kinase ArlS
MKLANKIHLFTTVLFIALLILLSVAIYFSFSRMLFTSELERGNAEASQIAEGINQAPEAVEPQDLLRAYVPVNGMIRIIGSNGKSDISVTAKGQEKLVDKTIYFYKGERREIIEYDGIPYTFISHPIIWTNGEVVNLQVMESLAATHENLNVLRVVIIVVTLIATIPVFLSARLLSNFITRPITSMIDTMTEIQKNGEFKQIQLPKQSKDELYQMGTTFNDMMRLLKNNYEKQEQFVSNASHELNTPLTIIESYASLLKRRGKQQPETFDESVEAIHSEAVRMKELTRQLLQLARSDTQWNLVMTDISLIDIVNTSVRSFREAYKREIVVNVEAENQQDHPIIVKADQQKLKQVLFILLDNACKYSDELIKVNVKTKQDTAFIEVVDRGIGIPTSDLPKVFDRFYRVDKARTRKQGGSGLGLSLAKEIAVAMNGDVRLQSEEGLGTKASILLKIVF